MTTHINGQTAQTSLTAPIAPIAQTAQTSPMAQTSQTALPVLKLGQPFQATVIARTPAGYEVHLLGVAGRKGIVRHHCSLRPGASVLAAFRGYVNGLIDLRVVYVM